MPHVYRLIVAALMALGQHATEDKNFRVIDVMTGNADEQPAPGAWMAENDGQWATLWGRVFGVQVMGNPVAHLTTTVPNRPSIDFRNNVVVAIVIANVRNSQGMDVVGYSAKGDTAIVRLANRALSMGAIDSVTTPFAFVIVPRTVKPIEIQVPASPGPKPQWKTLATFPPTLEEKKKA